MKLKKEYVILFTIIAVLVLYIVFRKDSRIQYEIPDMAELAAESISAISINDSDTEIFLKKEKGEWLLGENEYEADPYSVKKMINFLVEPVIMTVVSDSGDYLRYGLDSENRIRVKAFAGDDILRELEVGYQTDNGNYTFIKLENDERVFHAREDLRDIFSTDIEDLRNKSVLSFSIGDVNYVEWSGGEKKVIFKRKQSPDEKKEGKNQIHQWETEDGSLIDDAAVNSVLNDILKIKCAEYLYGIDKDELKDHLFLFKVKDENEHILTVFPKKDDDFIAVSSDNPTVFSLYSWRIDNIIEKFEEMAGLKDSVDAESD